MEIMIVVVAVLILGAAAIASAGGLGQMATEPVRDTYAPALPEGRPVGAEDLKGVRFGVSARGYDMEEVDAVMARLARELDERSGGAPGSEAVTPEPEGSARPAARTEPSASERAAAWRGRPGPSNRVEVIDEAPDAGAPDAGAPDAGASDAEAWRPGRT